MREFDFVGIKRVIMSIIVFLYYSLGYFGSQLLLNNRTFHYPYTIIDIKMFFFPPAVIIYLQVFFIVFIPAILTDNFLILKRTFYAYILNMTLSYIIFIIYPVTMPRHSLNLKNFFEFGLAVLYFFDKPVACFPSMHVSMAFLASFVAFLSSFITGLIMMGISILIAISTLILEQHYFIDVISGLLLALFSFTIIYFIVNPKNNYKNYN